ncbi:MAG: fused MFS/spermidine synthase [Planctomycetota bacterium]|nr:fused MFS/spermidine synthase [Planctomycetota bacterium]
MNQSAGKDAAGAASIGAGMGPAGGRALAWTAGVCGGVMMGVEIAGSRVLAPSFGNSIFVWGGLIGLLMGAMAAGYWIGGRLADRFPRPVLLAWIVALAGAFVFAVPYFGGPVCREIAARVPHRTFGPLLAAAALFFAPCFLLATVSPFAVKLAARNLTGVGGVAGRLYALSTFGSIAGTLLTTFVLIPAFEVANILCGLGLLAVLLALWGFVRFERAAGALRASARHAAAALGLLALAGAEAWLLFPPRPYVPERFRLIRYEESSYQEVAVIEEVLTLKGHVLIDPPNIRRWLTFDMEREIMQGGTYAYRGRYSNAMTFSQLVHLSLAWVPKPRRMLVVGAGVAVVPAEFQLHYPSIERVDVLEIDDVVVRLAQEFFQPEIPRSKVVFHVGDGRTALNRLEGAYDLILLDAYASASQIPYHLLTWEFLRDVKARLAPGGVVLSNIRAALHNDDPEKPRPADILFSAVKTLRASRAEALRIAQPSEEDRAPLFRQLYLFPRLFPGESVYASPHEIRNVIVICTDEPEARAHEEIVRQARFLSLGADPVVKIDPEVFEWHARNQYRDGPTAKDLEDVPVLTDDYAPVDTMYLGIAHDN